MSTQCSSYTTDIHLQFYNLKNKKVGTVCCIRKKYATNVYNKRKKEPKKVKRGDAQILFSYAIRWIDKKKTYSYAVNYALKYFYDG